MTKKINKYLCYLILFIPVIGSFKYSFKGECDIWFLFSHGRYVLTHGFPHVDFLSLHQGLHFVMQQWLSSVIFYVIYKYFGMFGLYIFVWIFTIIILFLIYKLCMLICNNMFISSVIAAVCLSLIELAFITCRPIIFSLVIFILLIYLMELYRKKPGKSIYFLILLSLLEVNLHASMWPILFILLLPYVVYYAYLFYRSNDRFIFKLLFIMLLMVLVGFINPYGIESMTYSLRSYGSSDINNTIWEMNGLNFTSTLYYVRFFSYLTFLVMLCTSYIFIQTKKKIEIYKLLLFYGTYFMALSNIRNIPLFLIVSLVFCSQYINYKAEYINDFNLKYKIAYILMFICTVGVIISSKNNYIMSDEYLGQRKVLEYMEKNVSKKEPIYTMNTNGGYYSYYGYKTYIDTRAEVFLKKNNHKKEIFHEFYLNMNGRIDYKKFLDKYKFNYLVVNVNEPLKGYLDSKLNTEYKVIYKSKRTLLYKKSN